MSGVQKSKGGVPRLPALRLDPSLYEIASEESDFLKSQTGIEDEQELKQHVLSVQQEAWGIVNYRCIQNFDFLRLKISGLPMYQDLLRLGRENPRAIFLDYACCFGNDARKTIADGYPNENVIASDLRQEFWNLGHKLYKSTPVTFPVPFIQGDVFDPEHIAPAPPLCAPPSTERPNLSVLRSLTPLQGHVSAIHVSAFFHLFGKEDQIMAARALASLLSPHSGSMIFGMHSSTPISKEIIHPGSAGTLGVYCFSPEDWRALWDGIVFEKGSVSVEVELLKAHRVRGHNVEYQTATEEQKRWPMVWCVKRI